ncbi:sensor histidine kinase [Paenibacillus soyae]|uniref:histidine kinase n=1 Tax=Paenibacillus soyae TaxID=2969249 RepID=A0A9X2SC72_9BACL|nr:sensor histidine kinase [Paenibacillus soyae]MCR2805717.1 sensor histidine kinase [Paenibacillus soyae]
MKRLAKCLTILIALLAWLPATVSEAGWSEGKADYTDWSFQKDGIVNLDGEWELVWNRLLTPDEIVQGELSGEIRAEGIKVPGQWGGQRWGGEELSNHGYATYRLTFVMPESAGERTMGLYIRSVATSYRLWMNGEELAASGRVGTDRASMTPRNVPQTVYFQPKEGDNELVMQVANFVQRKGGIWESIRLGDSQDIARERERHLMSDLFIVGSLFLMGLYHVCLFAFRRKDRIPLYFGILCLAIGIRTLVLGETAGMSLFSSIPWEIGVKLEYGSACVAFLMFMLYANGRYPVKASRLANGISAAAQIAVLALVLLTPARIYTLIMLPYQLLVAVPTIVYVITIYGWAAWKRREGSMADIIGFVFMAATIVNDILFYNQVIATGTWMPFGLLALLFMQAIQVSAKFSKAFYTAEALGDQLKEANVTLEGKVAERTAALSETNDRLEEANKELLRMERFRAQLLANISHELGTPLTSIKGYASAMMDGVVDAGDPKYARRIHERTLLLERVIDDLIELTKLETRQLPFRFEELDPLRLFHRIFDQYATEWADEEGLRLFWKDELPNRPEDGRVMVTADSFRLEQVFSNVLGNARKYAGGDIIVSVGLETKAGDGQPYELCVKIVDSGPGIPDEEVPRIFDRFYRGRHGGAGKKTAGSGLGLAICKEIMAYHHGSIGYAREEDARNAFYFRIPAHLRKL